MTWLVYDHLSFVFDDADEATEEEEDGELEEEYVETEEYEEDNLPNDVLAKLSSVMAMASKHSLNQVPVYPMGRNIAWYELLLLKN